MSSGSDKHPQVERFLDMAEVDKVRVYDIEKVTGRTTTKWSFIVWFTYVLNSMYGLTTNLIIQKEFLFYKQRINFFTFSICYHNHVL